MDNTVDNTEENMRLAREDTKERLKITRICELKDAIEKSDPSNEIRLKRLFKKYFKLNSNNSFYMALLETVELVNCKFKAEIVLDTIKPKFYKFCIEKNLLDEYKNFGDFTIEDIENLEESKDEECSKLAEIITNALIRPYEYKKTTEEVHPAEEISFKDFDLEDDLFEDYFDIDSESKNLSQSIKLQSFGFVIKGFDGNSKKRQKE